MSQAEELKQRTKKFALRIIRLFKALPRTEEARVIGRQVLRSGTSVAVNYRAACRARSKVEFIARIGVVVEEADETIFWLALLIEAGVLPQSRTAAILKEANELFAIFVSSQLTAKPSSNSTIRQFGNSAISREI